ncbi:hypothetical protein AcW1_000829 [Taiwanofungus camphoratus]|nr:hypothetical protein AcW2_000669 [Antrodia cinnamomea]KAI0961863.1 hypothetical protein AcV7_000848 [Antrodia cinnamomea]KAI0963872.1 hypothetical protein AcW1_000829 [Antrodia cinnamomea]
MLRNVCRIVAPHTLINPLAPVLVFTRDASQRTSSGRVKSGSSLSAEHVYAVPSGQSTTSTVLSIDPAKLLHKLDQQLQAFHGQAADGLSNSQAEIFNRTIPELHSAAQDADLNKAWSLWTTLKKRDLLRFFGPSHYGGYSRFVTVVCDGKPTDHVWSPSEVRALEEMALVTAAGGATDGLKAYMLLHIRRNDADMVLHLYQRYRTLLDDKQVWKDIEEVRDAHDGDGSDQEPGARSPAFSLVRAEILLAAIAAHTIRNAFADALHLVSQTSVRFSGGILLEFLTHLDYDQALRQKVRDYVRRLEVASLLSRPSSFSKQLSNLSKSRADSALHKLYGTIMEGLSEPNAWLTAQASAACTSKQVLVPEFGWAMFITGFLHCRRMDLAEKVWDDVLRLRIRPNMAMWTALIDGYAELKAVNEAVNTWNVMLAQGYRPDALTHRALIYALYHAGQPNEAFRRFQDFRKELPKMTPRPHDAVILVVYNTVLHGLLFHFQEVEARALLEDMQTKGPKPDIVTFNTFLRFYGRTGQLKSMAGILQMIEPAGLVGDVFTFSIILSALLKVREDAPQIMFNLMEKQGVKPNAATLTAIIDHQMRAQTEANFRTALELLAKMEQNQVADAQPNEVTYTSILAGIHRGNWLSRKVVEEYRQLLWERMLARNITPHRVMFNILIKSCLENPEREGVQDALHYYREMVKRKILVANDTWYIILHALVSRKEWALANELVEDIRRSGFMPAGALSDLIRRIRKRTTERIKAGPASYI